MVLRRFDADDVDFAVSESMREGWATSGLWFELFLALDPDGSFILQHGDVRAGMVTTTRHEKTAWIGSLIVPPERRGRGFGSRLMMQALDYLQSAGVGTVRLDADPPGISIYRRLGFLDECESMRFRLDVPGIVPPTSATPMAAEHLEAIARLDERVFGDNRSRLLRLLFQHAEDGFIVERHGQISGFAFLIATTTGVHVGPMIADDECVARELWGATMREARGRRISVGIPAPNRAGCDLLRSLGFQPRPSSLRMTRGVASPGAAGDGVFALGSGAFG